MSDKSIDGDRPTTGEDSGERVPGIGCRGVELGPFAPPPDYRFELELADQPPRTIPAELHQGRYVRGRRKSAWGLLLAGSLCFACSLLPVVHFWALFVLPLKYLSWIGLAGAVMGVGGLVSARVRRGPFRYVTEGVPLVVRIRELSVAPTVIINGQPSAFRFVAGIEYRDPETGQVLIATTHSHDVSAEAKEQLTTSYRVGDYATAVYLRSDPAKTLRLYGFLDLRPGLGLVRRDGSQESGLLQTLLLVVALFAFFGVLGWNVYAYGRYAPLELKFRQGVWPVSIGAVLLGGGLLGGLAYSSARARRQRERRNEQARASGQAWEVSPPKQGWFGVHGLLMGLVLVAGALLLGGATMLCWCFTINALADHSQPELRPVRIQQMIMTTHSFLFREYTIEYQMLDAKQKHKLLSTPQEMSQFNTEWGVAEVHTGRLGWPWVRRILPVKLPPQPPLPGRP